MAVTDLFDEVSKFPDADALDRYHALAGLDELKARLSKQAKILVRPDALDTWSREHHGATIPLVEKMRSRPPLFIFAGDVGTGKTSLAETFGAELARAERVRVTLLQLSLSSRGQGTVGEMTTLITRAFSEVKDAVPVAHGKPEMVGILLIDEADAIAQSREAAQMHHEDRADVNALIRGIDALALSGRPIITVLCTNRLEAIDPAVRRRAFGEYDFVRPDESQRRALIAALFEGVPISPGQLDVLARVTGGDGRRGYGVTWSDLTVRLTSAALLDAFPARPITGERLVELATLLPVTPPFTAQTP